MAGPQRASGSVLRSRSSYLFRRWASHTSLLQRTWLERKGCKEEDHSFLMYLGSMISGSVKCLQPNLQLHGNITSEVEAKKQKKFWLSCQ